MIWFWSVAGLLVAAVLIVLLRPLVRGAAGGETEPAAEMFRRQLAAIDAEATQGRLDTAAAEAARTEVTRRMLAAAERGAAAGKPGTAGETSWRLGAAVAIAGILPAAALAIYAAVGTPSSIGGGNPAVAANPEGGPHTEAELATAAERLRQKLKAAPNDVDSWVLLGRTLVALDRYAEAHDAYDHALKLAPAEPELHAELGEVIVLEAQGAVTPAAEAEFAKAGNDPRARFYGAQAKMQRGDVAGAKAELVALLKDAPPEAPWRKIVAQRLAQIAPGTAIPAPGNADVPGPSAADIATAQKMSPADRQAMIRGMVARLAAKMERNPDDKEGWLRLARAYDVLGDKDKAEAARARAAAASPAAAAESAPPGPTAADIAAAQNMSPEQQQAMIRGMVARLAAKMEKNPGDKEGWLRLAHAYDVLGDKDKAEAARARAAAVSVTAEAAPPGPTAADGAAPQKASPEQQQAMIAGMVGRLAARMQQHPEDPQGWLRLARSYEVLGRNGDALAALKRGTEHVPENLALLTAYMEALAGGMSDERPTPDLVNAATRVNALDAKEPDALWYLGLAAAARGDKFRAAGYWSTLAAELPAGSSQKKLVQQRLDALR